MSPFLLFRRNELESPASSALPPALRLLIHGLESLRLRATRPPLHFFDFGFFGFLTNDRGDRLQLFRAAQVH
jgi:hypothetical protein